MEFQRNLDVLDARFRQPLAGFFAQQRPIGRHRSVDAALLAVLQDLPDVLGDQRFAARDSKEGNVLVPQLVYQVEFLLGGELVRERLVPSVLVTVAAGQVARLGVFPYHDERSREALRHREAVLGDAERRVHQGASGWAMMQGLGLQHLLVYARPRPEHFNGAMWNRKLQPLPQRQVGPVVPFEDLFQVAPAIAATSGQQPEELPHRRSGQVVFELMRFDISWRRNLRNAGTSRGEGGLWFCHTLRALDKKTF
jgi:hypothetical protein